MPHLAATADRIDYWIRKRVVPCPVHSKVNPSTEKFLGLTAIGNTTPPPLRYPPISRD
jgi:hypothetical protein